MAKGSNSSSSKSHIQYRSAGSGRYVTEKKAAQMKPQNVVKERVPNPGHGDTDRGKNK